MKILITSGGTKIPIDSVRNIRNMSKGTFGSKIAMEALKSGHDVTFFKARESKSPFQIDINLYKNSTTLYQQVSEVAMLYAKYSDNYEEVEYDDFYSYYVLLQDILKQKIYDIIILAAAVSDYGVMNYVDGKIRSKENNNIQLKPLPKVISSIKQWSPKSKLVGFKLLVNSTELELTEAAKSSIVSNHADMIVANDLRDIQQGKHKIMLVFPNDNIIKYESDPQNPNFLAEKVIEHSLKL